MKGVEKYANNGRFSTDGGGLRRRANWEEEKRNKIQTGSGPLPRISTVELRGRTQEIVGLSMHYYLESCWALSDDPAS